MKTEATTTAPITVKPGDWHCPAASCNELNFGSRTQCRKCGSARPTNTQAPASNNNNSNSDMQEDQEKDNCVVCMAQPSNAVITVCGHLGMCMDCAKKCNKCPVCRASYSSDNVLKVFLV